ncbi:hypothetical protein AGLY_009062 [Aphis glycines]|uniref:Uncharacterized protein n=1 Tax=Aphis glycines TaxID=307491 RepID=A0A6G0TIR6_APHGL|nr:hypothetical protein AGLY_009062 [Aphis glycines]
MDSAECYIAVLYIINRFDFWSNHSTLLEENHNHCPLLCIIHYTEVLCTVIQSHIELRYKLSRPNYNMAVNDVKRIPRVTRNHNINIEVGVPLLYLNLPPAAIIEFFLCNYLRSEMMSRYLRERRCCACLSLYSMEREGGAERRKFHFQIITINRVIKILNKQFRSKRSGRIITSYLRLNFIARSHPVVNFLLKNTTAAQELRSSH